MVSSTVTLKEKVFVQLHTEAWRRTGLSPVNTLVATVVLLSIVSVVLETEPSLSEPYGLLFKAANLFFLVFFCVEYATRLWVMGCDPRYRGLTGRLRFILTWPSVVDLLAILPFFIGFVGSDAFLVRVLRLLRIVALAKIGQFSAALQLVSSVVAARRLELAVSFLLAGLIIFFSAVCLYVIEGRIQQDAFGSIPRALWWGIATLTTVGYGDVYPITPLGKVFASVFAIAGIGVIAMPTGILAAALGGAFARPEDA